MEMETIIYLHVHVERIFIQENYIVAFLWRIWSSHVDLTSVLWPEVRLFAELHLQFFDTLHSNFCFGYVHALFQCLDWRLVSNIPVAPQHNFLHAKNHDSERTHDIGLT